MQIDMQYVKLLGELRRSDLSVAGGKAANLGAMIDAGLPVPDGFCITTNAYLSFIKANKIEDEINRIVNSTEVDKEDISSLENVSSQIRGLFLAGRIPEDIAGEIRSAYTVCNTENGFVAVRSSATVEDLPDMSFAGQQDTFLNITGVDALLDAVVRCWASLWNARAIGYRARISMPQHDVDSAGIAGNFNDVALAVVVQKMVQSEVSGVLFTANPLTGKRTESVVDATIGLGEALVSGQVEPDHYVCDNISAEILSKTIGAKAISIRGQSDGGTTTISTVSENKDASTRQAIADDKIVELVRLGKKAVNYFQTPQDIEWAVTANKIFLVQSRPITSLYPLPNRIDEAGHDKSANKTAGNINSEHNSEYCIAYENNIPLKVWFSFGSWQGMLDPYTPIGRGVFTTLATGVGLGLGLLDLNSSLFSNRQNFFADAGERLYVNITPLLHKSFGRRLLPLIMAEIEPAVLKPIELLLNDPRLNSAGSENTAGRARANTEAANKVTAESSGMFKQLGRRFRLLRSMTPFLALFILNVIRNIKNPAKGRERLNRIVNELIAALESDAKKATSLVEYLNVIKSNMLNMPVLLLPNLIPIIASGQIPLQIIKRMSADLPGDRDFAMELTRGLPYNVTTEMDLALWAVATSIKNDNNSFDHFIRTGVSTLADEYFAGSLPATAQNLLTNFMNIYGVRGIAEIDIGRPRWGENPDYIMQVIKNYLQIDNMKSSPEAVFKTGSEKARIAADELIGTLKSTNHGPMNLGYISGYIKSRLAGFMVKRVRELGGMREFPKFSIIRIFGVQRNMLLACGRQMTSEGILKQPADIFYLHLCELEDIASGDLQRTDFIQSLIARRKQLYEKEKHRKRIPRMLLSDGEAFFEGITSDLQAKDFAKNKDNVIVGNPVSAGVVEGVVRVVTNPLEAHLQHGEIMVCPATDPAWTPLFLSAGGLIMEVGGMMTHGSVVAREYGIPAVVGVNQATSRLKTGQKVRLDGSSGKVYILKKTLDEQ